MSQPPHEQQRRQQQQEQRKQRQQSSETYSERSTTTTTEAVKIADAKVQKGKSLGINSEPQKVTKGRNGESNVVIEWGPGTRVSGAPWYPFAITCFFDVKTTAGNSLEVTMEQLQYRRTHEGTGNLRTSLIPVAPVGTKGKVIARDMTTGEIVEQPWQWRLLGGGSGLWAFIKRLLFKSD